MSCFTLHEMWSIFASIVPRVDPLRKVIRISLPTTSIERRSLKSSKLLLSLASFANVLRSERSTVTVFFGCRERGPQGLDQIDQHYETFTESEDRVFPYVCEKGREKVQTVRLCLDTIRQQMLA